MRDLFIGKIKMYPFLTPPPIWKKLNNNCFQDILKENKFLIILFSSQIKLHNPYYLFVKKHSYYSSEEFVQIGHYCITFLYLFGSLKTIIKQTKYFVHSFLINKVNFKNFRASQCLYHVLLCLQDIEVEKFAECKKVGVGAQAAQDAEACWCLVSSYKPYIILGFNMVWVGSRGQRPAGAW